MPARSRLPLAPACSRFVSERESAAAGAPFACRSVTLPQASCSATCSGSSASGTCSRSAQRGSSAISARASPGTTRMSSSPAPRSTPSWSSALLSRLRHTRAPVTPTRSSAHSGAPGPARFFWFSSSCAAPTGSVPDTSRTPRSTSSRPSSRSSTLVGTSCAAAQPSSVCTRGLSVSAVSSAVVSQTSKRSCCTTLAASGKATGRPSSPIWLTYSDSRRGGPPMTRSARPCASDFACSVHATALRPVPGLHRPGCVHTSHTARASSARRSGAAARRSVSVSGATAVPRTAPPTTLKVSVYAPGARISAASGAVCTKYSPLPPLKFAAAAFFCPSAMFATVTGARVSPGPTGVTTSVSAAGVGPLSTNTAAGFRPRCPSSGGGCVGPALRMQRHHSAGSASSCARTAPSIKALRPTPWFSCAWRWNAGTLATRLGRSALQLALAVSNSCGDSHLAVLFCSSSMPHTTASLSATVAWRTICSPHETAPETGCTSAQPSLGVAQWSSTATALVAAVSLSSGPP
jgi:hypothetical protein